MAQVRNLYLLLAREVEASQQDGMTSITKIIERFNSIIDPDELEKRELKPNEATVLVPVDYAIATSWFFSEKLKKDTFVTIKISLVDPKGIHLNGPEQEHLVPKGTNKINLNFDTKGLLVTSSGEYTLHAALFSKEKKLLAEAEYPYVVDIQWQAATSSSPERQP